MKYGRVDFVEEVKKREIEEYNDKKLNNKVKFLYSVKNPESIIYKKELEALKNDNFDYKITVTRGFENMQWDGRTGRIDVDYLKENIENVKESVYFLCGGKEFVHSIIEMLESLGVVKDQIKTDIWG